MRPIFTLITLLVLSIGAGSAQNTYIHNHSFEITNWQSIAWFSQTNTGSSIIVDQNAPLFTKDDITANTGIHFAYIGGIQSPAGLYQATLTQEFSIPYDGHASLNFYLRSIRESIDPGSYVSITIDGNEVWSIAPHYLVDESEYYEITSVDLGSLQAGNHVIAIQGYENPMGGGDPMQFAFDDFVLQSSSTASIHDEKIGLNVICLPNLIQIQTNQTIGQDVEIELVDITGKVIANTRTYFENTYSLPVENFNTGIYIFNIKSNTLSISKKIFVQQ